MRPKSIALAASIVLTAGGLSTAALGGAAAGDHICDPSISECVLVPPKDAQAYHAAFPDFGGPEDRVEPERLESFEDAAGRPVSWAYFSNNWFHGKVSFPEADVQTIDAEGRVPFVRLMARSGFHSGPDPNFSMKSIAEGDWDTDIHQWCADAADVDIPLLAEFGTEVNGFWFPWNGRWNGAGHTGWGEPRESDGPESFRLAYRRIIEACREEGADDITWFFHADVGGWPQKPWNDAWNYYPGDDVIDWVGLSDYGPQKPGQSWESFRSRMDDFLPEFLKHVPDKPIAVLEYGAAAAPTGAQQHRKANWISNAARLVGEGDRWPDIRALAYWHESWKNGDGSVSDLHIDSSRRVQSAYRHALGGDEFADEAEFDER